MSQNKSDPPKNTHRDEMTASSDSDYERLPLDYTASELREVERTSAERSHSLRRRSMANAFFGSVIVNLVVIGILFFATVGTPPPTPPKIVASAAAIPNDTPDLTLPKSPMESNSSPSGAPIESLTVNVAMTTPALSSLSLMPTSISTPSDFSIGLQDLGPSFGVSSGFGTGIGGEMGSGAGSMGKIGRIAVRAKRLGVVLDVSPSMKPHLPIVRREIRKSFRDTITMGVNGCSLNWNPGMDSPNAASMRRSLSTNKENSAKSVIEAIDILVNDAKVDAIYWFSDLQDGETPEGLQRLQQLLHLNGDPTQIVRFYIRSLDQTPARDLKRIVRASGGEADVGPMESAMK